MVQPNPASGPGTNPQPVDPWVDQSFEALKKNRSLAPAQRALQLREMVKGRSLDELQGLAEKIVADQQLSLSTVEERVLAVRVREELSPKELNELTESRDRDKRLQIMEQRLELLILVSQHLKPGPMNKVTGGLQKMYHNVISTPNMVGDFFRRQGDALAKRSPSMSVGFRNQLLKGFYYVAESPAMVGKVVSLPAWLSNFTGWFRERRARIETEERIYMTINHIKTKGDPKVPFIEFAGFDPATFEKLKEKHLAKDAEGNVTSEEFTEKMRTLILRDVTNATQDVIENKRDKEKGGDDTLGTTEGNPVKLAMKDLLNPQADVVAHNEKKTNELKDKIVKNGIWDSAVKSVEFGETYEFSRADGKLTLPREAVNDTGAPTTDDGRSLQAVLTQLPPSVKKITVVAKGEQLVLGDEVQLPIGRHEIPAQLAKFITTIQLPTFSRVSVLRTTKDQTMLGLFRYIGESGTGVIEWNNTITAAEVEDFLSTPNILDNIRPPYEWKPKAGGGWEGVA